ncbi:lipid asymmetry maintenance protein MlaB [Azoarcus sp. KH32C]|uniref:STAS domain-containing protein n=1 Tax=Azoarcus sp. KH32C TaxID=748247 RepID=UPI000238649E|nr:STAS domain-containing protein [Azoarcus sp. KH32C]BAL23088.1 NTP-binding protein [Azoarcus sp. KH32C]
MSPADAQVLALQGPLTIASVGEWRERGRELARKGDLTIDLSAVTEADSAALAVLIDWLRTARGAGHTLTQRGMPGGLCSLAALYGVDELIPAQA